MVQKRISRFSCLLNLDHEDSHGKSLLLNHLQFRRIALDKTHNLTCITVLYGTINNRVTLLLPVYFSSRREAEFMQYRKPVGFGPSSKT